MADSMNLNVRISGALKDHVTLSVSEGDYENVSEYVRDLIRKDKREREEEAFAALKAELENGFAQPVESGFEMTLGQFLDQKSSTVQ